MTTKNRKAKSPQPRTHEGAPAMRIGAEAELRRTVLACLLWEDTFYESGASIADRLAQLAAEVPAEVVAALAIEAREQYKLRHVPLALVRALAARRLPIVAPTLERVIQRADELGEFLALYWASNKDGKRQPLAAAVKRGLAAAFRKFDAYSLAKYDRRDAAVKLRDVLFMCRAKPKDAAQAATWKQLIDRTLPSPDTWEVAFSSAGKEADKAAIWVRLLAEQKLGALALLRNLRNMQEAKVPTANVRAALETMKVERVFPYRFIAAARYAPNLEPELEQAMYRALEGQQKLAGRTALVVDHSGSMEQAISTRSDLNRFEAAAALAILARELCDDVVVIGFGTTAATVPPRRGFALRDALNQTPGGGTNTEDAKQLADREGYTRIVIITDEQSHQALSPPLPGTLGYVVNVAAYQHGIGYGPWTHVDGWSEQVLRYVAAVEGAAVATPAEAEAGE